MACLKDSMHSALMDSDCISELPMYCYETLTNVYLGEDDLYRKFVKAKVYVNYTDYTYSNVNTILQILFDGEACLWEIYSNPIKILVNREMCPEEKEIINLYTSFIPAPIGRSYEFYEIPPGGSDETDAILVEPECSADSRVRECIAPEKISEIPDQTFIVGEVIDEIKTWRYFKNYGEKPTFSLTGSKPRNLYIDSVGNIKGKIDNGASIMAYTSNLDVTTPCGSVNFNFNISVVDKFFEKIDIKPEALLDKAGGGPSSVFVGYNGLTTGLAEPYNIYGEKLDSGTTTPSLDVVAANLCSVSGDTTSIDNGMGKGDYQFNLSLRGDHTTSTPFNNVYTGNQKYDSTNIINTFFDGVATKFTFDLTSQILPCWYFDIDFSVAFPDICAVLTGGEFKIDDVFNIEKSTNLPGLDTIKIYFD